MSATRTSRSSKKRIQVDQALAEALRASGILATMIADPKAIASAGWSVLAHSLKSADLDDDFLPAKIAIIERTILRSRNRVCHIMNSALIAISDYTPTLTEKAIAASQRIRRIEVDHGQTECKTPDAAPSIRKMAVRAGGKRA